MRWDASCAMPRNAMPCYAVQVQAPSTRKQKSQQRLLGQRKLQVRARSVLSVPRIRVARLNVG
jgi:hypothetical protein